MKHLNDFAKGVNQTEDFKHVLQVAETIALDLQEMLHIRNDNFQQLKDCSKEIITQIQTVTKDIRQVVNEMEGSMMEELERVSTEADTLVQADIDKCVTAKTNIENLTRAMKLDEEENVSLSYIAYRKCKENLTTAEKTFRSICKKDYKLVLVLDSEILRLKSRLDTLGQIQIGH